MQNEGESIPQRHTRHIVDLNVKSKIKLLREATLRVNIFVSCEPIQLFASSLSNKRVGEREREREGMGGKKGVTTILGTVDRHIALRPVCDDQNCQDNFAL